MKKILLISHLNIWTMGTKRGGPALWQTLNGYAKAGWKVFFITGNAGDDSIYEVHPNIQIIRFDLKWLRRFFSIKCIGKVSGLIWWPYFQIKSYLLCRKIVEKEKIDVFCGYESYGVPVAKLLAKKFHKPLISRFQGTGMGAYLNKRIWRAKSWKEILAMKIPTDLIIMTNDGTQGNQVLKKLKACSKETKFWVNGVDTDLFDPEFDKDEFKKLHGIKPDDKILLALSRLIGWKRVDRIILAMEKVAQQYSNVKLLIGGDGV
ncbi:MAG: glycosyltransferase family 4 protein, partial [Planctomycetota bacterium]